MNFLKLVVKVRNVYLRTNLVNIPCKKNGRECMQLLRCTTSDPIQIKLLE
jgi:hypothetical protein